MKRFRAIAKWARRDRRTALLLFANLGAFFIIILVLAITFLPKTPQLPAANNNNSPNKVLPTATLETIEFYGSPPTPLPPTVNPTQLAALPNQGRSNAPVPPPGLMAVSPSPSTTITNKNSSPSPSATSKR